MTNRNECLFNGIVSDLKNLGYEQGVAVSASNAAMDHYRANPNLTFQAVMKWAEMFAKRNRRAKGAPSIRREVTRGKLPQPHKWGSN